MSYPNLVSASHFSCALGKSLNLLETPVLQVENSFEENKIPPGLLVGSREMAMETPYKLLLCAAGQVSSDPGF